MHISRKVVRPLVALVVILGAVVAVSNVAAFRVAATTHNQVSHAQTGNCQQVGSQAHRDGDSDADTQAADTCSKAEPKSNQAAADDDSRRADERRENNERGENNERREDGGANQRRGANGDRGSGNHVVIVTQSGAS